VSGEAYGSHMRNTLAGVPVKLKVATWGGEGWGQEQGPGGMN
jgi:hypothetical protein